MIWQSRSRESQRSSLQRDHLHPMAKDKENWWSLFGAPLAILFAIMALVLIGGALTS